MTYFIGLDWSEQKHDLCILSQDGRPLSYLTIEHSPQGLACLGETLNRLGIHPKQCLVALETHHNLIVDSLLAQGFTLYIIPPKAVSRYRDRHRRSRSRSDRTDAFVLANILRTDRHLHTPYYPDGHLTCQIRAQVRLIRWLDKHIKRFGNQLRTLLLRYYPQAVGLFSDSTCPTYLEFLISYPSPRDAQALSFEEFTRFCREHHFTQRRKWSEMYLRLQGQFLEVEPGLMEIYAGQVRTMASLLLPIVKARNEAFKRLRELYERHPDHGIFSSLPGVGLILGASLLAKFGDRRERFTSPEVVQALAGTCPVTSGSGKKKVVRFRRACDKEFRHIMQQMARNSIEKSGWAKAYFEEVYRRCGYKSQAYRCLANRWVGIIWKMWQDRKPYDEAYHLSQIARRGRKR